MYWIPVSSFDSLNLAMTELLKQLRLYQPVALLAWNYDEPEQNLSWARMGLGLGDVETVPQVRAGHIIGMAIYADTSLAGVTGTLSIAPTINGTRLSYQIDLDSSSAQAVTLDMPRDLTTIFEIGDRLGIDLMTDATWDGIAIDFIATLFIQYPMEDL